MVNFINRLPLTINLSREDVRELLVIVGSPPRDKVVAGVFLSVHKLQCAHFERKAFGRG